MAKSNERRKNFWDEEEEEKKPTGTNAAQTDAIDAKSFQDSLEIDKKLHDAKTLMDSTHQLFLHYFNGYEKRVPLEKAKILEARVMDLRRSATNITSARFKINQFISQYTMMKELWERKLRDKEKTSK